MLLRLLVVAGGAFVVWFVISQMIIPAYRNTPSFPLFRRTYKKKEEVAEEIRGLHVQGELTDLEKEAAALKRKQQKKGPGPQEKEQD